MKNEGFSLAVKNLKAGETIRTLQGSSIDNCKLHLIDLMITLPTILIILNRKEEAFYCLERCLTIGDKYNYIKTKAKLIMMIAGLYLNDKLKSFKDTWNKAYEAMNIFIELEDGEGIAETNFLFAMIIRKKDKVKQHKADSLILRRQSRSEYLTEEDLEFETEMQRASSQALSIEEDEMSLLEKASQQFCYLKHKYGMARVSLAIATRYIELASKDIWYVNSSKS